MPANISDKQNKMGIASLLIGGSLCGTLGLFTASILAAGATSMTVAFLRLATGTLFLIPFVLVTVGPKGFRITGRELCAVFLIGAIGLGLNNYCYMTAMQELGIASAAVLMYTAPGFLVLLSTIFFKDRLTGLKILAVLLNFGGSAVMVTGGNFSELTFSPFGLLIGLCAGLTFALNNLLTRALAKDMDSFVLAFYGFLFGALTLCVLVQPWNGLGIALSPANLLLIAGFGILPTACGYGAYYNGLLLIRDKAVAPVISSTENIVACLLGFLVLGEFFNLWKLTGILMVLLSIVLISRSDARS